MKPGTVYLIGAGPGDPGLITLRAVECLKRAEVVVYDQLVSETILEHASIDAERIYAGKKGGCHSLPQEDINRLLVEKAKQGKTVARLKGGDPYIFGRGGEEASYLFSEGIPFEVVPGVSSASAAPAYAGIPLTDRRHNSAVTLITGHEDPTKAESSIRWDLIAPGSDTLVFLMGVKNLPGIVENLIRYGRPKDTPVAIVQQGTTPRQKTIAGTLGDIVDLAERSGVKPPSITIVGSVVTLREQLNWFEKRPLFGRRIVVTRSRQQASTFLSMLQELGAEALAFPTIETIPPESWEPLDEALKHISRYHWIIFTSVNGVINFKERLWKQELDARSLSGIRIGAIGPATAERLEAMGLRPDLVPSEYRAEAVIQGMRNLIGPGVRVLIPRALQAREILPEELRRAGAEVDVVPAYQTVLPKSRQEHMIKLFMEGKIDLVAFTSSSTVANFARMFPQKNLGGLLKGVAIACIGPITAETAGGFGLETHIQPRDYTITGLVEAIVNYFRGGQRA
jgi:uroporphyrinogen III methyltransferase/synthase